jgi:hypothetical protein
MDTDDGTLVTVACFQPPDAENRTSGGVEGSRGAIPATPSDHEMCNPTSETRDQDIARMCRPADSARGYSTVCMQAVEKGVKHPGYAFTGNPGGVR